MRLNQFLAKHIGISRRKADELIKNKDVRINGVIGELHNRVSQDDSVEVLRNGTWETFDFKNNDSQVLLLYKPIFTMTTRDDPEKRRTVYDIIPNQYFDFKTAGRLDYMSEGLLVFSPNGHLILSMTHPKFKTQKNYLVGLRSKLKPDEIQDAKDGNIFLEDYRLNSVTIDPHTSGAYDYLKPEPNLFWYEFTLSEGRNQQIRKMAKIFGNKVQRLIRTRHGRFELSEELKKSGFLLTSSL